MKLYHNPRCSKSREALHLCRESGKEFTIISYLESGLSADEIRGLTTRLSSDLHTLVRDNEAEFDKNTDVNDLDSVVELLMNHPKCLQRPILDDGKMAIVGRPPELLLTLLQAHE